MRLLITGGNGFIGSNLTEQLQQSGHVVISLDLYPPKFSHPNCYIKGDVCDQGLLEKILGQYKIDVLIHLAAVSTIQAGAENKAHTVHVNVDGTYAILKALSSSARQAVLIYASTDKVYGLMEDEKPYTELSSIKPLSNSPYDCSKAEADLMVLQWSQKKCGCKAIVLRFCNIYGRYDIHTSRIVPGSLSSMLNGFPGVIRKYLDADGNVHDFYRNMLYIDDLCAAFLNILNLLEKKSQLKGLSWGQAYNIGAKECISMTTVVEEIQRAVQAQIPPVVEITKNGTEIASQCMDYAKAQRAFEFNPQIPLARGIQETAAWWRSYLYCAPVKFTV